MNKGRERVGEATKLQSFLEFQIMRESFTRSTERGEEREFFNPLKGCVSSRGVTFSGGISCLLKLCLANSLVKMRGCHVKGFISRNFRGNLRI